MGVIIDGTAIEVSVTERSRRVEHVVTESEQRQLDKYGIRPYPAHDLVPTGLLRVQPGHEYAKVLASDGERWKIEDRVGAILQRPEVLAVERAEIAVQMAAAKAKQLVDAEVARQRAVEARIEKARVDELLDRAHRHRAATAIRHYLAAAVAARTAPLTTQDAAWIAWAERQAAAIDPVADVLAHRPRPGSFISR